MLTVRNLACHRGEQALFANLDFSLEEGGLAWLNGANGSGKTSLLRILCGLGSAESGEILWNGIDIRKDAATYSRALIYVAHVNGLKDDLTAVENLMFTAKMRGANPDESVIEEALTRLGVAHRVHLPVKVLSQGQRRRVALSQLALRESSPLWILDEPFTALDVQGVGLLADLVGRHIERGGMAILTSHQDVAIAARKIQQIALALPAHA